MKHYQWNASVGEHAMFLYKGCVTAWIPEQVNVYLSDEMILKANAARFLIKNRNAETAGEIVEDARIPKPGDVENIGLYFTDFNFGPSEVSDINSGRLVINAMHSDLELHLEDSIGMMYILTLHDTLLFTQSLEH